MKMMTLGRDLIIITALLIATECVASQKDQLGAQRYCGRNLVNVLTMVCDGIYNQMALKEGQEPLGKTDSLQKTESPVFREKRSVASIFQGRTLRRRRRGAYEECCRKGCTIEEMVGYCGTTA